MQLQELVQFGFHAIHSVLNGAKAAVIQNTEAVPRARFSITPAKAQSAISMTPKKAPFISGPSVKRPMRHVYSLLYLIAA